MWSAAVHTTYWDIAFCEERWWNMQQHGSAATTFPTNFGCRLQTAPACITHMPTSFGCNVNSQSKNAFWYIRHFMPSLVSLQPAFRNGHYQQLFVAKCSATRFAKWGWAPASGERSNPSATVKYALAIVYFAFLMSLQNKSNAATYGVSSCLQVDLIAQLLILLSCLLLQTFVVHSFWARLESHRICVSCFWQLSTVIAISVATRCWWWGVSST